MEDGNSQRQCEAEWITGRFQVSLCKCEWIDYC